VSLCSGVDAGGEETAFDPASPAPSLAFPGLAMESVACAAPEQCVAVGLDGSAATYQPAAPAEQPRAFGVDGEEAVAGVACPSTTQCTAVDRAGGEVTFDPAAPGPAVAVTIHDAPLASVACPDVSQCTAVDASGLEITFDPVAPATASSDPIDAGQSLTAVACPSATLCVAVDEEGRAFEGDPVSAGVWTATRIDDAALTAISCPSVTLCVAVDDAGNEIAGIGVATPAAASSVPVATAAGPTPAAAAPPPAASASGGVRAPNTLLVERRISRHRATFRFEAAGAATGFECALVRREAHRRARTPRYAPCASKRTFSRLRPGAYVLYVRAVGPGGVDGTPVVYTFRIRERRTATPASPRAAPARCLPARPRPRPARAARCTPPPAR